MARERKGLLPQHHGELNKPSEVFPGGVERKSARVADLRKKYSADPVALQQIDVYDPVPNEYHRHMKLFIEALKSGDTARENELNAWFKEHYPDI